MKRFARFDKVRIKSIEDILQEDLIDSGIYQAVLTDIGGNIIAHRGSGDTSYDVMSLSVLAASNIGSLKAMSRIIGEDEFPMFALKGERDSIYFCNVSDKLFLISIYNRELSPGFVRNRVEEAVKNLIELLRHCDIS